MFLRNTAPNSTNPYYRTKASGGYSPCITPYGDGSTLPNCVGYAWGAFSETLGFASKLRSMNAENFYNSQPSEYERGSVPKLGAIACWQKGPTLSGNDGAGHVAQVIEVAPDGTILTANSGYKGTRFWLQRIKPPYNIGTDYKFLGFIYAPVAEEPAPKPIEPTPTNDTLPVKYTIKRGDTLSKIAKKYYGSGDKAHYLFIAQANGIVDANKINAGDVITIPVYAEVKPVEPTPPASTPAPVDNTLRVGDEVEIIGRGNANSFGTGVSTGGQTIGWRRRILDIKNDGRANPIRVGNDSGTTGWFKASALRKI
jgi:surface antigen/LysM repeat protein